MRFSLGHSTSQNPVSQHVSLATKCSADDKSLKKKKKTKSPSRKKRDRLRAVAFQQKKNGSSFRRKNFTSKMHRDY